jgi:hypothetical protein
MSSVSTRIKCQPLKCETFKRMFDRFYDKVPVDAFVVKCPYRSKDCCMNGQEKLERNLL